jgi:transposase
MFLSILRPLPFVGIDDFSFKKRTSYGTILIDLKTKQPIDLLDSRGQEKVMEWLKAHPNIKLITRDGSRTYAKAITHVSEDILQVGDRWHILHQLFEAVKKTITGVIPLKWKPSQKAQRSSEGFSDDIIVRKSDVARLQNEEKRWARIQEVQSLHKQGYSVTAIHKKVHISRSTVYADLRQKERPSHKRDSPYQKYHPLVHSLVRENQSNRQIEARCRSEGYTGSLSTLNAIIAEVRRQVRTDAPKSYSFRQKIINILWDFKKGHRMERLFQLHPCLLETFPEVIELEALVHSFRNLFNEKNVPALDNWMREYQNSEFPYIISFINGLNQDLQAVRLSVQEDWSNGVTEGHVNRLKTFKRLMYGRASFPVLKNRVLYHF